MEELGDYRRGAARAIAGDSGLDRSSPILQNGGILEDSKMATLNVKNLSDALYRKLQARARRHRRSVAQEVAQILSETLETPKPVSILDLQGLGKQHWQDIDAAPHVARERDAWD
jgi:plasmid stability protein